VINILKKRVVSYNLTNQQHLYLRAHADSKELSVSELLRRIIDEWFENHPLPVTTEPEE